MFHAARGNTMDTPPTTSTPAAVAVGTLNTSSWLAGLVVLVVGLLPLAVFWRGFRSKDRKERDN